MSFSECFAMLSLPSSASSVKKRGQSSIRPAPNRTKKAKSDSMESNIALGIDLGTSFSSVAYYNNSNKTVEVIAASSGRKTIRSFVYFDPNTGDVSVGDVAYRKSVECPSNGIKDSKMLIGRMYNDTFISTYSRMRQTLFNIVEHPNGMAAISLQIKGREVIKLPEEISAEILKFLVKMANDYLQQSVKKVVITIPANFSLAQIDATKRAGELAGLEVIMLLKEPTAAAIHYFRNKQKKSKVLAFDWGGGTLDVSIMEVSTRRYEVKVVSGDPLLGGRDIDDKLFDHFHVTARNHVKTFERRLLQQCVSLKEDLTTASNMTTIIEDGDQSVNLSINRDEFNRIMQPIFQKVSDVVTNALTDSGWTKKDIDLVILVGGSSRIVKVRQLLEDMFGNDKLRYDTNPDEAIASGAAIQATLYVNTQKSFEKLTVVEVAPLSLGIAVTGNLFSPIIRKNSRLPAYGMTEVSTTENKQTSCHFIIYEGDRKNCEFNNKLTEFYIHELPEMRAGDLKITVAFELNEYGILTVTATESSTRRTKNLSVTMGQLRLSKRNIVRCEGVQQRKEEDIFEKFHLRKNILHMICKHLLYDIDVQNISTNDRDKLKDALENFLNSSNNLSFNQIKELDNTYKLMHKKIEKILDRNSLQLDDSN